MAYVRLELYDLMDKLGARLSACCRERLPIRAGASVECMRPELGDWRD